MKFKYFSIVLAPVFTIAFNLFYPHPSYASLRICNDSSAPLDAAYAYHAGGDWIAKGWWDINPGDCKTVDSSDLSKWSSNLYFYARHQDGSDAISGDYNFCTGDDSFTIWDNDTTKKRCGETWKYEAPSNCDDKGLLDKENKKIILASCAARPPIELATSWKGFEEFHNTKHHKDFVFTIH